MVRQLLYSYALNNEEVPESLTIDAFEQAIKKTVVDPRRLINEALQMESYLFSAETPYQSERNDWGLKLDELCPEAFIRSLVKDVRLTV
jgi:hypothetical protein